MIVVTGGHGFIGSHVVNRLIKRGKEVVVVDIKRKPSFHIEGKYEFVKKSITDDDVKEIVLNSEGVIHLAAISSVPECEVDTAKAFEVNAVATYQLYKYAGKKPFVFASSASVYGNREICSEDDCPEPLSVYGVTKLSAELLINATILRYFNVYGEGQSYRTKAVIPSFFYSILTKKRVIVYGDGNQTRDFIYVGDVVDATIKAFEKNVRGTFNIGTGKETSIIQLLSHIKSIVGREFDIEFKPQRKGDIKRSVADITKSKRILDFSPKTDLKEGLRRTYKWFLSNL